MAALWQISNPPSVDKEKKAVASDYPVDNRSVEENRRDRERHWKEMQRDDLRVTYEIERFGAFLCLAIAGALFTFSYFVVGFKEENMGNLSIFVGAAGLSATVGIAMLAFAVYHGLCLWLKK